MPTVLRKQGFRVVIYLNDHLPSHVHVFKDSGEVRIEVGDEQLLPSFISISGKINDKDVAKALHLVTEHQAELLAQWRKIHA